MVSNQNESTSENLALITGGAGVLGRRLAQRLLRAGCRVRLLDIEAPQPSNVEIGVEFFHGDVRNEYLLKKAMKGARWVFHAAALQPISRAGPKFYGVNVNGTRAVLEEALRQQPERIIYISSTAVYLGKAQSMPVNEETPLTPLGQYGRSKAEAEQICRLYRTKGLFVDILRPRVLLGAGRLGIFQLLFDRIQRGGRIGTIGLGNNRLQFLSVTDMAEACWLAATRRNGGSEEFCLGTDRFGTVREDLASLIRHAASKSQIYQLPAFLAKIILAALDVLRLSPLVDIHYQTPDKPFYFDITKARTIIKFKPTQSNAEMLAEAYDWFLEHPHHKARAKLGRWRFLEKFS